MNYLGHLYLSSNKLDLMLANMFGDFVKGQDYTHLPVIVQQGVKLHRDIDDFIDRHPTILNLLNEVLYSELPKVANIAVDLYMDHLLAKYWNQFHHLSIRQFEASFFEYALDSSNHSFDNNSVKFQYPAEFINLLQIIHQQSWILQYEQIDGLRMASTGLSRRISFSNNLNEADLVFIKHQNLIEKTFFSFIEEAQNRFNIT